MVQKQIEEELKNVYSNMSTSKKDLNSNPQGENESFKSFVLAIEILQLNTEERDSWFYIRGIERSDELFLGQYNFRRRWIH